MLVSELLNEGLLLEKLGNLSKLNVGSMINILKQGFSAGSGSGRRASYNRETETGKRFGGGARGDYYVNNGGFGSESEVVEVSLNRKIPLIAAVRKAYKEHENAIAFALYVDGKAVCFAKVTNYELAGSARVGGFAYDLSMFKDHFDKEHEAAVADYKKKKRWGSEPQPRKLTSYKEIERSSWDKKYDKTDKPKVYHGEVKTTDGIKSFLNELETLAEGKKITCKLVIEDTKAQQKRRDRTRNAPPSKPELMGGLDDLETRLKKYKISKKPTVNNIEEFLDTVLKGSIKTVQFAGRGYSTTPQAGYGSDKINPLHILNGKPFEISYQSVEPGDYGGRVEIYYVFDKSTGTLAPYKAEWSQKGGGGKVVAALKKDTFLKHELGVNAQDEDQQKEQIMKKILTSLKSSNKYETELLLKKARVAGHDYPEFKAIEKSLAASEAK